MKVQGDDRMLLETRALLIPEKGLLKSLSEFTGSGSVILDQNFTILHISKEIKGVLKRDESDLVGRNCLSLCIDRERESFGIFLADLNHESVSDGRIWFLEPKSGPHIPCKVKGMRLETSSGEPLYLLSLTESGDTKDSSNDWQQEAETCLQRETALYNSEERYRSFFDLCPDLVLVHWPAHENFLGEPLEVNPAACDFLGYSREELLMGDTRILAAEELQRMVAVRRELMDKKTLVFPVSLVTKNGQVIRFEFHSRYFETEGQPMILSVGREMAVRNTAEDMSLQVQREFEKYEIWHEKEGLWRVDNDLELFAELVEVFFRSQADSVAKMNLALADEDFDTLTKLAHSFKGAAGNLSAIRIQKISERIEKSSRVRRGADIIPLLPFLELETGRFRALMVTKEFMICQVPAV